MLVAIVAILGFGILVVIHEGGHFAVAKLFGVYVEKFSIGFGPVLYAFKKWGTEFRISLIPLGGYIKMKGENPDETSDNDEDSFSAKKWWKKVLIVFAGPFANLVLAFLIITALFVVGQPMESQMPIVGKVDKSITQLKVGDVIMTVNDYNVQSWDDIISETHAKGENQYVIKRNGHEIFLSNKLKPEDWATKILPETKPIIGDVATGMPAYQAGIKPKDKVLSINGKKVDDWYQMRNAIVHSKSDTVKLKILRGNEILYKNLPLQENILNGDRVIGITQYLPVKYKKRYDLITSFRYGFSTTIGYVALNYTALYKLISHPSKIKENIGGPVMLYSVSKTMAKKGINDLFFFLASISILLMVMNLLPIPVLDGGNIFFFIIEGIKGSPLSLNIQIVLQKIGFSMLIFLMLFAFINDITKLTKHQISVKKDKASSVK